MKCKIKIILLVCTALNALTAATPAFSQNVDADDGDGDGAKSSWFNAWFDFNMEEHPWYFGISGGFTQNTLYQGGAENYRPTQTWNGAGGVTIALAARYQVFNWLAVQVEPTYTTKNYGYKWTGAYADKAFNNTSNGFVDFPLLVNLSAGWGAEEGRVRVFANFGGFVGIWAHGNELGTTLSLESTNPVYGTETESLYSYDSSYEFDDRRDNRFDGGLIFGGGIQYDLRAFSVIAEFRYAYSLSDLQKQYQTVDFIPRMNSTWMITAGVLFNPGIFFGEKNIFFEDHSSNGE
jgi:hypothetical protein